MSGNPSGSMHGETKTVATHESVRQQVEDVAYGVRRMRERFEDAAVVEAARVRHAAQTPLTAAEERMLLFRIMLLGTRSWPAMLLTEIEHDLLSISGLPHGGTTERETKHGWRSNREGKT